MEPPRGGEGMSLWDQVKANMVEWYGVAADKTGEVARIGVRKYDQFAISREIERAFQELGGHVYGALGAGRTDLAGDGQVQTLCERIRTLEQQLADKEREIQAIRDAGRVRPGAAAAADAATATAAGAVMSDHDATTAPDVPAEAGEQRAPTEPRDSDYALRDEEIEASIDPGYGAGQADEPWDDEIAVWHEPLDIEEEPEGGSGADPARGR